LKTSGQGNNILSRAEEGAFGTKLLFALICSIIFHAKNMSELFDT